MGLDTSHDCWHGAYSAFMRWRRAVAKAAGIPLDLMENFWSLDDYKNEVLSRTSPFQSAFRKEGGGMVVTKDTLMTALSERIQLGDAGVLNGILEDILPWLPISWTAYESDPLCKLLNHSDCDGELCWQDCEAMGKRLEELLPEIGKDDDPWGHIGNWQDKTQLFIDGLRIAASRKENVIFR